MTQTELQQLLEALLRARFSGLRSTTVGTTTMVWSSDAELENKINALRGEIAGTSATRSRSTLTTFTR